MNDTPLEGSDVAFPAAKKWKPTDRVPNVPDQIAALEAELVSALAELKIARDALAAHNALYAIHRAALQEAEKWVPYRSGLVRKQIEDALKAEEPK